MTDKKDDPFSFENYFGECKCDNKYTIEKHGDAYALYLGRCCHRHGWNLCKISDLAHNCDLKDLERRLNQSLDEGVPNDNEEDSIRD